MKLPPITIRLHGTSKPPDDLLLAAFKSLGEHFNDFIALYGVQFTAADLVKYVEELRNGNGL